MLDLKKIVSNPSVFKESLSNRGADPSAIDRILTLHLEKNEFLTKSQTLQAEIKSISREVGQLKKSGEDASELQSKVLELKSELQSLSDNSDSLLEKLNLELMSVPNLLSTQTPIGKSESDNKEVHRFGTPREFDFDVKDHVDILENLKLLDFEVSGKLTGARFSLMKGSLAKLERALYNFMLDFHAQKNYEEVIPPYIVNEKALIGTGQLPKFSEDLFKIEGKPWYLIPTSEVPLTNIFQDSIIRDEELLPTKLTALTPCFRSEAGSYGKDTRGLIRLHQFNKVEMVQITHPEKSYEALEEMRASAQEILEQLELPYRTVELCSGDIGFGAAKTYDLEVWVPSQNTYREISSCSNCEDFQARRANIRFKFKDQKKPEFVHTLNGSGLAVGRTLVAIVENYQNKDGSITVPKALRNYMNGLELIK